MTQVGDVFGDGLEAGQEEVADGRARMLSASKLLMSGASSRVRLSMMSWGICDSYSLFNSKIDIA